MWIANILSKIMHPEQTKFVKGHYIMDNLLVVWEGLEWACVSCQKPLFLKIDFEKSYDRIEWPFILDMLEALGFGAFFCYIISTLFSNASAHLTINGHQS